MSDNVEDFNRALRGAKEAAELDEVERLDAARALIDSILPVENAGRFLEPDAVDAAALLAIHDLPRFAALQAELRPYRVLRIWSPAVTARTKVVSTRGALDDPALPIIREWLAELDPLQVCPDGSILTSRAGFVRLAQVQPDPTLIDRLQAALNVDFEGALRAFGGRMRVVWGELGRTLPRPGIKRSLAHLLAHPVYAEESTPWDGRKRALGTWPHYYALKHPGSPVRFGTFDVCGLIRDLEHPDTTFQIALRPELAGRVSCRDHPEIALMSLTMLTQRCAEAGIVDQGDRASNHLTPVGGRRERWVLLSAEFVQSLDLSYDHTTPSERAAKKLHRIAGRPR